MTRHLSAARGIRTGWVIAMIAVLILWVAAAIRTSTLPSQATQDGEWHLLALLVLIALTFPLGIVWAGLLNVVAYMLDAFNYRAEISEVLLVPLVWLSFFVVGYVQWFKLVPWLWRRWKDRRASR